MTKKKEMTKKQRKILPLAIILSIYYDESCEDNQPSHYCSDCLDRENARIRGVFFKKKSYTFSDITSVSEWSAAADNDDVLIIPLTHGDSDGGAPTEGPGYGDSVSTYLNSTHTINFFDPDLKSNRNFYNALKKSRNYEFGFRTEKYVWLFTGTAVVLPKSPVADDLNAEVVWNVQVKITSSEEPTITEAPDVINEIFTCFMVN